MSDKDIWRAYKKNERSNKTKITETYHQVLNEIFAQPPSEPAGLPQGMPPASGQVTDTTYTDHDMPEFEEEEDYQYDSEEGHNNRKKLIEEWIDLAGFNDEEAAVQTRILGSISSIVDFHKLHEFVYSPETGKNKVTLSFEGTGQYDDFDKTLTDQLASICKDGISGDIINNLYITLFGITFAENTVSVGRGELILTLLTAARKGTVGDIESPLIGLSPGIKPHKDSNIQVEVKTGKGRAISARGGMFKNANIAIERAVLGNLKMSKEDINNTDTYTVIDDQGNEVEASVSRRIVKSGKRTTVKYEPTATGKLLSIDEFISALKHADTHLTKLSPFTKSSEQLRSLLGGSQDGSDGLEAGLSLEVPEDQDKIRQIRHDASLACLLYAYANPGSGKKGGFNCILAIYQKGGAAKKKEAATMDEGTFKDAYKIDCTNLKNIYGAMVDENGNTGLLTLSRGGRFDRVVDDKSLDGEGVYVSYGDSNTNVGALSHYNTAHSIEKQASLANMNKDREQIPPAN